MAFLLTSAKMVFFLLLYIQSCLLSDAVNPFCRSKAKGQQGLQVPGETMQAARFALQRFRSRAPSQLGQIRKMSGAVSHEEEVKQMYFWQKVSIAGMRLDSNSAGVGLATGNRCQLFNVRSIYFAPFFLCLVDLSILKGAICCKGRTQYQLSLLKDSERPGRREFGIYISDGHDNSPRYLSLTVCVLLLCSHPFVRGSCHLGPVPCSRT